MNLLGSANYDPAVAVSKATSALLAMTALDTSNLRLAITVPSHGKVKFILAGTLTGATTIPTLLLGVLNGATVLGRVTPQIFTGTQNVATQGTPFRAEFTATGLTPGAMNVDAAYAVQVIVALTNIKYGGPNTNAGANAWGGFVFEAWDPQPIPTATPGAANGLQICGANAATTYASLTVTAALTVNGVSAVSQTGDAYARLGAAGAGLTALGDTRIANLDAAISSRMATYTQPTGFLAATFPASIASPTNITAGTITTTTNLTNAPTAGDFTATMKTSLNAATPSVTVSDKTGFSLTQAFPANFSSIGISAGGHILTVDTLTTYTGNTPQTGDAFARIGLAGVGLTNLGDTRIAHLDADISSRSTFAGGAVASVTGNIGGNLAGSVGSVVGLTVANLDATISSRLASAGYTAPDNTSITSIKAKTDNLPTDPADESIILAAIAALPSSGTPMTLTAAYDAAKTAAQPGDNMGSVTSVINPVNVTGLTDPAFLDVPVSSRLALLPIPAGRRS